MARAQPTGPRTTYVAVGGSDSVGSGTDDPLLDAWPQQFFRRSLPLAAVFVNAGVPGSTVAAAMGDQAPLATSSSATVVTVWLVSADILDGTPPATYGAELSAAPHHPPRRGRDDRAGGQCPTARPAARVSGLPRRGRRRRSGTPLSRRAARTRQPWPRPLRPTTR